MTSIKKKHSGPAVPDPSVFLGSLLYRASGKKIPLGKRFVGSSQRGRPGGDLALACRNRATHVPGLRRGSAGVSGAQRRPAETSGHVPGSQRSPAETGRHVPDTYRTRAGTCRVCSEVAARRPKKKGFSASLSHAPHKNLFVWRARAKTLCIDHREEGRVDAWLLPAGLDIFFARASIFSAGQRKKSKYFGKIKRAFCSPRFFFAKSRFWMSNSQKNPAPAAPFFIFPAPAAPFTISRRLLRRFAIAAAPAAPLLAGNVKNLLGEDVHMQRGARVFVLSGGRGPLFGGRGPLPEGRSHSPGVGAYFPAAGTHFPAVGAHFLVVGALSGRRGTLSGGRGPLSGGRDPLPGGRGPLSGRNTVIQGAISKKCEFVMSLL
eukprot:gene22639-biopygen13293